MLATILSRLYRLTFGLIFTSITSFAKILKTRRFILQCCNYHLLLGVACFVWVLLYNGEFWHLVNDYIHSYNAEIHERISNHNLLSLNLASENLHTEQNSQSSQNQHQVQNLRQSLIDSPFVLKSCIFLATALLLWAMCEILVFRAYAVVFVGVVFVIAGVASYFLDSLHIRFNAGLIDSALQTNWREASDYLTQGFMAHLGLFVVLPLVVLACGSAGVAKILKSKQTPQKQTQKHAPFAKAKIVAFLLCGIALLYLAQGARIIEVFKEQKLLVVLNPFAPIRASIDFAIDKAQMPSTYTHLGDDAKTSANNTLIILVIGESARAQNFAYSGYERNTNPYTSKYKNLIYFSDFTSCGVITAISVPCMLTRYERKNYTHRNLSLQSDSVLDVAKKAGFSVWWLSNNGGECVGGVCKNLDTHKVLYFNQSGQFDGDMLPHIQSIINNASENVKSQNLASQNPKNTNPKSENKAHNAPPPSNNTLNNTLLVVQLQGSHGARYDLRYPKEFETFAPVCANNELSQCENLHIQNAYDNSLIYTDFVLSQIIAMLESSALNKAMLWYVSDHGESLGEYHQYMHGGFPYSLAPRVQKHIPSFMWFKSPKAYNTQNLESKKHNPYSHDFVFHTLLGLMHIQSKDYDKDLDILK